MRVGEWQDRLGPMLKDQESRRPFDIHEYGREIIHKCIQVTDENKEQTNLVTNMKHGGRSLSTSKDMVGAIHRVSYACFCLAVSLIYTYHTILFTPP